jgi:phage FluMu protein Com
MTFETTNIYKVFETISSQIYRFTVVGNPQFPIPNIKAVPRSQNQMAVIEFVCPNCKNHVRFQANIGKHSPLQNGNIAFPVKDNQFQCPRCRTINNILPIKLQIEAETGQKIVE